MTRIAIRSLTKRYPGSAAPAVDRMDLDIDSGELLALLGPSGCGKSTTLMMLAGIYRPSGGVVAFDDEDVTHLPARRRGVGMVFQSYALYPSMTVAENIAFPLKHQGVGRRERLRRAAEMAELVELGDLGDRRPAQLSGGQRQRVALARALVKHPRILLLDEPMSNLDPRLRIEMRTEIRRIQQQMGITTVLVTHDQEEAMSMADRIAVMRDGILHQVDTPSMLYQRPSGRFVARFLGTPPINELGLRTGRDGSVELADGTSLRVMPEGPVEEVVGRQAQVLAVRPQQVVVHPEGIEAGRGPVEVTGRVGVVENGGHQLVVHIDTVLGELRGLAPGDSALATGDQVRATVHPPFHVFAEDGRRLGAAVPISQLIA